MDGPCPPLLCSLVRTRLGSLVIISWACEASAEETADCPGSIDSLRARRKANNIQPYASPPINIKRIIDGGTKSNKVILNGDCYLVETFQGYSQPLWSS